MITAKNLLKEASVLIDDRYGVTYSKQDPLCLKNVKTQGVDFQFDCNYERITDRFG